MFKCKACSSKDQHIASLKEEVSSLRSLVHVPNTALRIPELQLEADMILSGNQDQIRVSTEELEEAERINAEASSMLNGSYE